jgi:2-amino-4-hydroxy-6-hydroxymethyldihydropteridine diphosphokinase
MADEPHSAILHPAPGADVYLALGANLGDRRWNIDDAIARLHAAGVAIAARSAIYETDAVSDEPQPPYLNAVVRATTALAPEALLALCLDIERQLGRVRPPGRDKAPRTLDIDLLLYDARVIATPELTVPHPAMLDRAFVRIPLADVAAPGLRHPVSGDALDHCAPSPQVRPFDVGRLRVPDGA